MCVWKSRTGNENGQKAVRSVAAPHREKGGGVAPGNSYIQRVRKLRMGAQGQKARGDGNEANALNKSAIPSQPVNDTRLSGRMWVVRVGWDSRG